MVNFRDPITKQEFFFPSFRTTVEDDKCVYKDKYKQELVNPETGTVLEPIPDEGKIGVPMYAKFNPRTADGIKNIKSHFGKRTHHDNTQGAGRDERDQRLKDFKKDLGVRKKKGNLPI